METMLLNAEETATLLGLGRTKVYEMLAAGELPVIRIGRSVRVPRSALERWIEGRTMPEDERVFTTGVDSRSPGLKLRDSR
ncbi:MAG TPA: helix-turn-helix domain-containing protein [Candidatus Dormibacteraeota bacterium]|jgi:excisionase family DNA binding protein